MKCEKYTAFDHATEWAQVVSQLSCGLQSETRLASGAKIQHNNVAVCQNQRLRQGEVWLETHLHFSFACAIMELPTDVPDTVSNCYQSAVKHYRFQCSRFDQTTSTAMKSKFQRWMVACAFASLPNRVCRCHQQTPLHMWWPG